MANAARDNNRVPTLIGVSSSDGVTPVNVYVDPSTHRLKVDLAAGTGTVTDVSVVSANGFAGTVATSTTTPAITLSTTISGILKGNGTAISAATAGTDYTALAFKTIAVSGQTDVVADTAADTLTLVAGTNVTITTDAATDSITINSSGGASGATTALDNLAAVAINTTLLPGADDGAALGSTAKNFSDLFLASGGVINYANSNVVLTHTSGILTLGTGTLKIATPTNTSTSVVTIDGTQSLTNKTYNGNTFTAGTGVLTIAAGKTATHNATTTFAGTDSKTLTISNSGTLAGGDAFVLAIAAAKTLTVSNSITLAGTDSTTMTFPTTTATLARTDAGQTFTGVNTMTAPVMVTSIDTSSTTFTAFAGATTLMTIGGTGASASSFFPSTLDTSSSITGAIRTSGGISAAKSANIGTTLTVGTGYQIGGAASSGKILKANGTNFVASTETYAAPGTSGNVMTSDGTNWTSAAASGGTTVVATIPRPYCGDTGQSQSSMGGVNTTAYLGMIEVPFGITVNKISFKCGGTITVDGTVKLTVYTEDGQTQKIAVTTRNLASGVDENLIVTTSVSAVVLAPGNYYVMYVLNGTANIDLPFYTPGGATLIGGLVTSEPIFQGSLTVTASTPPATFTPSAITTSNSARTPIIRLDN